jgi:hypothetical protein
MARQRVPLTEVAGCSERLNLSNLVESSMGAQLGRSPPSKANSSRRAGMLSAWACATGLSGLGFALLREAILDDFHQFPMPGDVSRG